MRLEWDARKGRENLRKHGVSFEEASSVFLDRKSTRLNSSHSQISYGAFCLKKKTISCIPRVRWTRESNSKRRSGLSFHTNTSLFQLINRYAASRLRNTLALRPLIKV